MATVPDRFRRNPIDRLVGISDDSKQSCSSTTQLHVLAVDDSLVDRKVIERLLKISSCKGEDDCWWLFSFSELILDGICLNWVGFGGVFAVTAVESGRSALQYLGLDGENNSVQFSSVSKISLHILVIVCWTVVCSSIVNRLLGFVIIHWWGCLQGLKVNLIITDYSMPEMTGYELLKKIKVGSLVDGLVFCSLNSFWKNSSKKISYWIRWFWVLEKILNFSCWFMLASYYT